jgi:MFS family permease
VPSATPRDPRYKWVALSNTTLGALMSSIDGSIVVISLPAIFNGIHLNPLDPGSTSYLLWTLTGYQLVTAVLVVAFGRLGDLHGRVRMYNAGFAVFTVGSLLLAATPFAGAAGAQWIIGMRLLQGVGGACLFANSAAIITDAFPSTQRGLALGINGVAVIAGQFIGLLAGGLLAVINWRLVFFVSVPIGIAGTIWAYLRLEELGTLTHAPIDWWGNLTFAAGLTALLIGVAYGIEPYGSQPMGGPAPWWSACCSAAWPCSPCSSGSRRRWARRWWTCACSASVRSRPATSRCCSQRSAGAASPSCS